MGTDSAQKDWCIRDVIGDDLNYIYSSWVNSYWEFSQCNLGFTKTTFCSEYPNIIDHILKDSKVLVACSKEDSHIIYGYFVFERELAHYCFVKERLREFGIAKDLFQESGCVGAYTHRTNKLKPILNKYPNLKYNPFKLYKTNAL